MMINLKYKALIYNDRWYYISDIVKWWRWKKFWTRLGWERKLGISHEHPEKFRFATKKEWIKALHKRISAWIN